MSFQSNADFSFDLRPVYQRPRFRTHVSGNPFLPPLVQRRLKAPEPSILVVQANREMPVWLGDQLEGLGYDMLEMDPGEVLEQPAQPPIQMLILSVQGEEKAELDFCQQFRRGSLVPLCVLADHVSPDYVVGAIQAGADAVISQSTNPREILARIQAVLRRPYNQPSETEPNRRAIALDEEQRQALVRGEPVQLSQKECELLRYLIAHTGQVVTKKTLLQEIWGYVPEEVTTVVEVTVCRLRKKIEVEARDPQHLLTVHGTGYRFVDEGC